MPNGVNTALTALSSPTSLLASI